MPVSLFIAATSKYTLLAVAFLTKNDFVVFPEMAVHSPPDMKKPDLQVRHTLPVFEHTAQLVGHETTPQSRQKSVQAEYVAP